jgi:hypothetical protein
MVDCKRIGRGRRKGWGESWSLHSYRGHELEGKEIWKRLKFLAFQCADLHSTEHSLLNDHLQSDMSSKRSEGVPAFGLPLFSLGFLINSFLFQI